jgi:hypothetical protein
LSTEHGEELGTVYPRNESAIHLMLVDSNQENAIKVWS